jgi:hypothetical protein
MRGTLRAVATTAALLAVLGGCDEGAPVEAFEVSGFVEELSPTGGGAPIPGARVTFVSDTLLSAETTSDDDGRYRMTVQVEVPRLTDAPPFGQLRAEAEGFRASSETVLFDTRRRRVDLRLQRLIE